MTLRYKTRRLSYALLAVAVATLLMSFAGCDEEPITPDTATPANPTDVAGGEDAPDTAPRPEPIPCSALAGNWQLSVCDEPLGVVLFTMAGCSLTLSSLTPTIQWGQGALKDGRTLDMNIATTARGGLTCVAEARRASFSGTCEGPFGKCEIVGVQSL